MARTGRELAEMHRRGVVRPLVSASYDFEHIPDALARLQRGEIRGKAVVDLPAT